MLKSSGFKEKLYINDRALCVVGERIELVRQQRSPRRYANRNIQLSAEAPEEPASTGRAKVQDKRKTFKLNVKELRNTQACSERLRRIYETVEVKDFERILGGLYVSDERRRREKSRTNEIIAQVKPDEVYEHFFGRYYAHLRELASRS